MSTAGQVGSVRHRRAARLLLLLPVRLLVLGLLLLGLVLLLRPRRELGEIGARPPSAEH